MLAKASCAPTRKVNLVFVSSNISLSLVRRTFELWAALKEEVTVYHGSQCLPAGVSNSEQINVRRLLQEGAWVYVAGRAEGNPSITDDWIFRELLDTSQQPRDGVEIWIGLIGESSRMVEPTAGSEKVEYQWCVSEEEWIQRVNEKHVARSRLAGT